VAAGFIHSYKLAIVNLAIMGFFNMMFMTLANSTIQLSVDDKFRGRVMSVYTLAFAGTTPIGNLITGAVIYKYGPGAGFLMCGGIAGVLILALMILTLTKAGEQAKGAPGHSA